MSDTHRPCEIRPEYSVICPTRSKLERDLDAAQERIREAEREKAAALGLQQGTAAVVAQLESALAQEREARERDSKDARDFFDACAEFFRYIQREGTVHTRTDAFDKFRSAMLDCRDKLDAEDAIAGTK